MASNATWATVGDWRQQLDVGLTRVLRAEMDACNRTAPEVTKHLMILMVQSARALTKQSKPRREEHRDAMLAGAKYVEVYGAHATRPTRLYKFRFGPKANAKDRLEGTWEQARAIAHRGLAKRSWGWMLARLGKPSGANRTALPGVISLYTLKKPNQTGYIGENKLGYITHILPTNWEQQVETAAINKDMRQIEMRLQREMNAVVRRILR